MADSSRKSSELTARRRESALARTMLREGRAPKLLASAARVCAASSDEVVGEASGGWRLTCDCTRMWVLPNTLLGKLKGTKGAGAPPFSIRRFEDERFETVEQRRQLLNGPTGKGVERDPMAADGSGGGAPAADSSFSQGRAPRPTREQLKANRIIRRPF